MAKNLNLENLKMENLNKVSESSIDNVNISAMSESRENAVLASNSDRISTSSDGKYSFKVTNEEIVDLRLLENKLPQYEIAGYRLLWQDDSKPYELETLVTRLGYQFVAQGTLDSEGRPIQVVKVPANTRSDGSVTYHYLLCIDIKTWEARSAKQVKNWDQYVDSINDSQHVQESSSIRKFATKESYVKRPS